MTPAHERKAKERQRRKDAGEVRLEFWIPADKAKAVKAAVAAVLDATQSGGFGSPGGTIIVGSPGTYGQHSSAIISVGTPGVWGSDCLKISTQS